MIHEVKIRKRYGIGYVKPIMGNCEMCKKKNCIIYSKNFKLVCIECYRELVKQELKEQKRHR